jgi:hypothetical protein
VPLILNLDCDISKIHFCVGVCHDAGVALQIECSRRVADWTTLIGTDRDVEALSSSRVRVLHSLARNITVLDVSKDRTLRYGNV